MPIKLAIITMQSNDYSRYREWKRWDSSATVSKYVAKYFVKELSIAGCTNPSSALEIGFGNGVFLEWARSKSIPVVGTEIIPELVEQANARGFETYLWDACSGDNASFTDKSFDCIVAFDVVEHLSTQEIHRLFCVLSKMLAPGGAVILRFPNGNSPFSLPYFNGDYTHKTWLTREKLTFLAIGTGLQVDSYRNAARVATGGRGKLLKQLLFLVRNVLEITVSFAYFSKRIPLDPNAVAVLSRSTSI